MIDLKKEAAKFKEIVLEEDKKEEVKNEAGEIVDIIVEKAPEYDNDTKNAISFYNKAIEQIGNSLDDMAKANLRKAVQLRPDFTHAISLLAAIMLSKGDRNGVLKLLTNTDVSVKKIIQPYIDYLFGEFDKVEYTKERNDNTDDPFGKIVNASSPVVYVNNEGRKDAKPFEEPKEPKKATYTSSNGVSSGWTQAPFEIGSVNSNERRKSSFDEEEETPKEEKTNDFNYAESPRRRVLNEEHTNRWEKIERPQETKYAYQKIEYHDKVNSNTVGVDSLMGGNFNKNDRNQRYDEDDVEIKTSIPHEDKNGNSEQKANEPVRRKYTQKEIKRNRLIALSFVVLILLVVFLVVYVLDTKIKEKREKAETAAPNYTVMAEDIFDGADA